MSIKLNIVEKADSLFRTFGIRGVTVDDICKACGFQKKQYINIILINMHSQINL